MFLENTRSYIRRHGLSRSMAIIGILSVIVGVGAPLSAWLAREATYKVSTRAATLLPAVKAGASPALEYDSKAKAYQLKPPAHSQSKPAYGAQLSEAASQGIRVTNNDQNQSIKITPLFVSDQGRQISGDRFVYPLPNNGQVIYTPKQSELKEDIVLAQSPRDGAADYAYRLDLPDTLAASLMPDGSIGIFSKTDGAEVFGLPAPTIKQTGTGKNTAKAWFTLSNNTIHLKASGLNTLAYPISIDPTVTVGTWATTSDLSGAGVARRQASSVAWNNYVYVMGGYNCVSSCSTSSPLGDVLYAHLNTDGTVGAWASTSSFAGVGSGARFGQTSVVSNGYVYIIGGYNFGPSYFSDVLYAPINSNGTLGAWQTTTGFAGVGDGARDNHTSVVYNGYVYIMGGAIPSGNSTSVIYAPINPNGTLGTWQTTNGINYAGGVSQHTSVAYNGFMYSIAGFVQGYYVQTIRYAAINSDGTLGTWQSMPTNNLPVVDGRSGHTSFVYNGGVYVLGGYNGTSYLSDVLYAPFNSDGTLGAWQTETGFAGVGNGARAYHTSVVNNDYIYVMGGGQGGAGYFLSDALYAVTDSTQPEECDTNAVVYCGAWTKAILQDKINNGDGLHSAANLQQIFYTELGFTPTGINNMVDGQMYPNGDIYVGATLVATGGRPSGREQQHPTDTQVGSLWRRADANFRAGVAEIDVLVNMDGAGSTFQYAVMKPCGNPVVGEPVGSVDESPGPSPSGSVAPPPTHNCCQITHRSVTLGSSVVSASTTAGFQWNAGTATTTRAVKIMVCTTTSYTDVCTKPTGANMSAVTLASTGGQLGASGWSLTNLDDHTVLITKAAGSSTTVGGTQTVGLAGFVNPSVYGTFHFRISTYNTTDADTDDVIDCGTVSTSTAKSITTTANVSEMLVFRVANEVAFNCTSETDIADPNDSTEDLVTLSPDPISLTTAATSTAQFCIVTNAGGGYVITYRDEALGGPTKGFWNGAHEFPVVTNFTSTPGTEQFGFNLRANTVPVFGADPDAAGLVTDLTNPQYSTVNQYSYNDTGTAIVLASKVAPSTSARYTLAYLANISTLTPGGTYTAHQVFVATAAF